MPLWGPYRVNLTTWRRVPKFGGGVPPKKNLLRGILNLISEIDVSQTLLVARGARALSIVKFLRVGNFFNDITTSSNLVEFWRFS